jgi:hypothetical protein
MSSSTGFTRAVLNGCGAGAVSRGIGAGVTTQRRCAQELTQSTWDALAAKGGTTQCVDNLTVRHTLTSLQNLVASRVRGGTLELLGSASSNPAFDAALVVRAGADIQGMSQHGMLRVVGGSCMGGPLSVSQLYGPVTVGADPAASPPVQQQLLVQGDAGVLGTVSASAAEVIDLTVADALLVDGLDAGPLASARVRAAAQPQVVSLWDTATATTAPTHIMTAFAVGPTLLMANATWPDGTAVGSGGEGTALFVTIGSGAASYTATIAATLGTGGTVLLQLEPASAAGFTFPGTGLRFAPAPLDTPPAGTPVLLLGVNPVTSVFTCSEGVVTDSSASAYYEYTSLAIAAANPGSGAAMNGGVVLDLTGRVLALVQDAGTSATGDFTGIKARYLSHFLDQALANPSGYAATLPVLTDSYSATRSIRFTERLPVGGDAGGTLLPGGVTFAPVGTAVTLANQVLKFTSDTTGTVMVGGAAPNAPSLQDQLLLAAVAGDTTSVAVIVGTITLPVTLTGTQVYQTAGYWSNGPPIVGSPFTTGPAGVERSTSFTPLYTTTLATAFADATFNGITGAATAGAAEFGVFAFGNQQATSPAGTLGTLLVSWGSVAAQNTWFTGLDGVDAGIKAAWAAVYPSVQTAPRAIVMMGVPPGTSTYVASAVNLPQGTPAVTFDLAFAVDTGAQTLDATITPGAPVGGVLTATFATKALTINDAAFITASGVVASFNISEYTTSPMTLLSNTQQAPTVTVSTAAPTRVLP